MPYHPDHHRVAPWQVAALLALAALLLVAYLWSFRAGRERTRQTPPTVIPGAPGALPAPAAPNAPAPVPARSSSLGT
jgi:hypothetical protein